MHQEGVRVGGIETYYLNNATDRAAARLAKQENKASGKKLSDVEHILSTMLQNHDTAESAQLARDIQKSMMTRMSSRYPSVADRGVRSALFYVLVGAKCPAVLLETSFISIPLRRGVFRCLTIETILLLGRPREFPNILNCATRGWYLSEDE